MKAHLLYKPASLNENPNPLKLVDIERPEPRPGEILVRVKACGVCHTDLHLVEGELPNPTLPIIPGHEVIGMVEKTGKNASRFQKGDRVGIYWLHDACGHCAYCQDNHENLCEDARFTGYTASGGYAEYITVPENYAVPIPDTFSDVAAAPLLCAGVVGYRSIKLSALKPGEKLGIYGFGASGHICLQVARHWNCEVYVFTRSEAHQKHSLELGATWAGQARDIPPAKIDRSIIFAPAGWIVPLALGHLRKAGTLCINAIHMSPVPEMPYDLLWHERTIRSVANVTRQDADEFLPLAAEIPIQPTVQAFDFDAANHVLKLTKDSQINGAAVLKIG